ncbi:MAG TPA: hypothetical protein ENK85_12010 [Saprospiraceae bacterium]|nr:hypothetical protein [Saprospiraceae bacterium]
MLRFYFLFSKILWFILLLAAGHSVFAQAEGASDTLPTSYIYVDRADQAEFLNHGDENLRKLTGNVILHQDTVFMFCDTAFLWDKDAKIVGNVSIQQGDSLTIYADSLLYDSVLRRAKLFGEVILKHKDQELHTHRLDYDLVTKKAYYLDGAILKDEESQLYSKIGHYYVQENTIYFKDSVTIDNPSLHLQTDTLAFNTKTRRATFLAPTLIEQGESLIYCEAGYYDLMTKDAEFRKNAEYKKKEQQAWADTMHYDGALKEITLTGNAHMQEGAKKAEADKIIYQDKSDKTILQGHATFQDSLQTVTGELLEYDAATKSFRSQGRAFVSDPPNLLEADILDYDKDTGFGKALGNVIWRDTSQQLTVFCDTADYRKEDEFLLARGDRPLLINVLDGDSLFMRCDTIMVQREIKTDTINPDSLSEMDIKTDTIRTLSAFHHVRMYKSDMQAVCDSLSYTSVDSSFRFFNDPIIWADTTQFTADTIRMEMVNEQLHQIDLLKNAFLINSEDLVLFNQIVGKVIHAYFVENEIHRVKVEGNAKSVYYALDEGKGYIGINKVEASSMLIFFGHNQVERIRYYSAPKGEMQPIQSVNPKDYQLKGFKWEQNRRPVGRDDL